jgi:hypothetical protein
MASEAIRIHPGDDAGRNDLQGGHLLQTREVEFFQLADFTSLFNLASPLLLLLGRKAARLGTVQPLPGGGRAP